MNFVGGMPGDRHFVAQMQKHQQSAMGRMPTQLQGHMGVPPNVNASHLPPDSHFNPRSALPTHPMYR